MFSMRQSPVVSTHAPVRARDAAASEQNQPLRVVGFFGSHVFDAPFPVGTEKIKAKAVALLVDFLLQAITEVRPLRRIDKTLENGELYPLPEILAESRHAAKAALASFAFRLQRIVIFFNL